ncbi:MAG: TldD/PmbA family protein, partial [Candidatus Bipolaricaulota bacterium]
MLELLQTIAQGADSWVEVRYHARRSKQIRMRNGRLEESSSSEIAGVGVRVLVDGVFGFASTTDTTRDGILRSVQDAQQAARTASSSKKERIEKLAPIPATAGAYGFDIDDPLEDHSLEEKLELVRRIEGRISTADARIVSSTSSYAEIIDEKIIATSDGVAVHLLQSRPEFRTMATAQENGEQTMGMDSVGVNGGWSDLFAKRNPEQMADHTVRMAVDQLSAPFPEGEQATVVLDPGLVGVLAHEAIGHTVEADLVLGGAITMGKIGEQVASPIVTLCDSGLSEHMPHAVGTLPVDDEGVPAQRTVLIDQGILRSFLHDRETAAHFDVAPTGNARAWEFSYQPLIRMRNTYVDQVETPLEEMFGGVKN